MLSYGSISPILGLGRLRGSIAGDVDSFWGGGVCWAGQALRSSCSISAIRVLIDSIIAARSSFVLGSFIVSA